MVDCLVEFDYTADQDDELSLKKGDIIKNVIKQDGGWWEGEIAGKKGMFPDNFVKEIKKEQKTEAKKEQKTELKKEHKTPDSKHHKAEDTSSHKKIVAATDDRKVSNVAHLQHKLGNTLEHLGGPMPAKNNRRSTKKKVKVTFAYTPENEDELALEVGDIVEVTKQQEEGWWEGQLKGKTGVFPSNFVESFDEQEETTPPVSAEVGLEKPTVTETAPEIPGKKVKGVGLGNIFSGGPIKLRPAGRVSASVRQSTADKTEDTAKDVRRLTLPNTTSPPERPPTLPPRDQSTKPIERAKVIFSYSAENDDEISLEEGDIVTIMDKDLEDGGWWKGELRGKLGVFPDNFVELIFEEKPKKPTGPVASGRAEKAVSKEAAKPEKIASTEQSKISHKSILRKEEEKAPPSLPKKPVPPPISRKPEAKTRSSMHEEQKIKTDENIKDTKMNSFDTVESEEKLTHLTAARAKYPHRRPPSSTIKREAKDQIEDDTTVTKSPPTSPTRPPKISPLHGRDEAKKDAQHKDITDSKAMEKTTSNALLEMRKELSDLKRNSVSRSEYDKLREDLEKLHQDFKNFKSHSDKNIKMLMSEVDEEKKIRLSTQVEIERIRKLTMNST